MFRGCFMGLGEWFLSLLVQKIVRLCKVLFINGWNTPMYHYMDKGGIQVIFTWIEHKYWNKSVIHIIGSESMISGTYYILGGNTGKCSTGLFCQRLLRPADVTFLKTKNGYQKFIISGFQNYFQTRFYLHISICQSQFIKHSSMWDTL